MKAWVEVTLEPIPQDDGPEWAQWCEHYGVARLPSGRCGWRSDWGYTYDATYVATVAATGDQFLTYTDMIYPAPASTPGGEPSHPMTAHPVAEGELRRSRVPTPLVYAAPDGVHLVGRDGAGKCWAVVLTAGQAFELLGALSEVVDDLA